MKSRNEKESALRTLLVLILAVLMAVMFMPAGTLAYAAESETQQSASQSVDKTPQTGGENGSAAANQKNTADGQSIQKSVKSTDVQPSLGNDGNTTDSADQQKKENAESGRTKVYLDGKNGSDNPGNQGISRGLDSDKPVQTFEEAKRVYYEARQEGYKIDEIEIDGTVTIEENHSESWDSADTAAAESNTTDEQGSEVKRSAAETASASSDSVDFDSEKEKQDQAQSSGPIRVVRGNTNDWLVKVEKDGTLTLKNIIIDGDKKDAISSLIFSKGTLNIQDGAVLQNNQMSDLKNQNYNNRAGGAVRQVGGSLKMTGGTIRGNSAVCGGGVCVTKGYDGSRGVFNMSGGSIEENHAVTGDESGYTDAAAAGGGVVINDGADMNFSGGTIKDNDSDKYGGGISVGIGGTGDDDVYKTLNMTSGLIDGNTAGTNGGGIFVQQGTSSGSYDNQFGKGIADISGGTISHNQVTGRGTGNAGFGGGGIYVNGSCVLYCQGKLNLADAVIHDNSAKLQGGGLAGCPSSQTRLTEDTAIYRNTTDDAEAGDIYLLADLAFGEHSGSPDFNIPVSMRGGNPYHWKDDHNDEVPLNKLSSDMRKLNQGISESLNLHTEENPGDAAENSAPVKICGNRSETRGGGIGSNGNVSEGTKSNTQVTAQKKWDDKSSGKKRPDSIQVQLFRSLKSDPSDKQYIGYITLTADSDGKWTKQVEFKNLPEKDAAGNEYIYTIGEKKIDGYDATIKQDDKTKEFTIINKPSQTPPTPTPSPSYRHITVQKVWKLDDGGKRPASVQVQLMRNGTAYGQPVTLNDANNWTCTWDGLADDKSTWTVQEVIVPNGFTPTQQVTAENNGSKVTITNDDNPVKPNKPNKPGKPGTPTKPNKTVTPKTPSGHNKTVLPKTPSASNKTVTPKTPSIQHTTVQNTPSSPASEPQTSDQTRLGTDLILFGGAAAALAATLVLKRKENE